MVDADYPFADGEQRVNSNPPADPFIAPQPRRLHPSSSSISSSNSDHELRLELDAFQDDDGEHQGEQSLLMQPTRPSTSSTTSSSSNHPNASTRSKRRKQQGMVSSVVRFAQRIAKKAAKETQQVNLSTSTYRAAHTSTSGLLSSGIGKSTALKALSPQQRALWEWANVHDIDGFLQEVYSYYVGKGIVCIVLSRALSLLTGAFVIGFSIFLLGCIDYSAIRHDGQLSDVVVGHCVSHFSLGTSLFLLLVFATYGWQLIRFGLGVSRLLALNRFYVHLLGIPETDIQAIPWHSIVTRISDLQATNPIPSLRPTSASGAAGTGTGGAKLDAHDVANRLMRSDNYLIALFNKDVLHLGAPISLPFLGNGQRNDAKGGNNMTLTRALEWNITFCLMGYLLDERGQVRKPFVSDRHRAELIEGLKRRFLFMAIVNAILAPFIFVYLLMFSFFRYFEEYHKDPSNLGSRQYTQYAKWKLREFNELPHLFRRRCHASYGPAEEYVSQFPKEPMALLARFAAFLSGSFMAVLLLASLVSPDLFLHFEITQGRNVLFYVGVFGTILAVSRGMIPDERADRKDPEELMRRVVDQTHYMPEEWKGKLHSAEVHKQFSTLFSLKLLIFLTELLSVLVTPLILYRTLPNCAEGIIDFFREFTVHVDGLGYLCSFAVFDFERRGSTKASANANGNGNAHAAPGDAGPPVVDRRASETDRRRLGSKQNKMELSLLNFKAANPDWHPSDPSSSRFLERVTDAAVAANALEIRSSGGGGVGGGGGGGGGGSGGLKRPFSPTTSRFLAQPSGSTRSQSQSQSQSQKAARTLGAVQEGSGSGPGPGPGPEQRSDASRSPAAGEELFVDGRLDGPLDRPDDDDDEGGATGMGMGLPSDIWRDADEADADADLVDAVGSGAAEGSSGAVAGSEGTRIKGTGDGISVRGMFREVYEANAGTRASGAGRAW